MDMMTELEIFQWAAGAGQGLFCLDVAPRGENWLAYKDGRQVGVLLTGYKTCSHLLELGYLQPTIATMDGTYYVASDKALAVLARLRFQIGQQVKVIQCRNYGQQGREWYPHLGKIGTVVHIGELHRGFPRYQIDMGKEALFRYPTFGDLEIESVA